MWTHRQLLLTGYEHLWTKQVARLQATLASEDATNEIGAAHAVKERLRLLLTESDPPRIRACLFDFYKAAADSHMDETTRLARAIESWWPAILTALTEDVTNARTEGFNRIIKYTKRVGCGYRNVEKYRRRILAHSDLTRKHKSAA